MPVFTDEFNREPATPYCKDATGVGQQESPSKDPKQHRSQHCQVTVASLFTKSKAALAIILETHDQILAQQHELSQGWKWAA
ncbi:hypothetical protein BASA60_001667 [Batrachochytrium salamandrivorans]|nr:hypothetical protein BASA60_001667 [Batrachochytrium salamandrivorans]